MPPVKLAEKIKFMLDVLLEVAGVSFIPGMGAGLPLFITVVIKSIILLFKPRVKSGN